MNQSSVIEFIFAGLTDNPKLNIPLFIIFLHVYIMTVVGNSDIITIRIMNKGLYKPMYLFLSNLSFVDLMYSSAVTPKMLRDFLSETKAITFVGCAIQIPLLYEVLMSSILCLRMLVVAYSGGFVNALVHTTSVYHLNFCRSNIVDHFFCGIPPLYKLSCSDISINQAVLFILEGISP
uniref:G-protein coupled receptors family 1 profile domain-containing protein n=1 Tax=Pyxicephalus adspersus TaxID=30357 RepID=A0AAV2ZXX8_PYXAD|nr:TPA: hypothetical protein GDO54_004136 [Pyxicephalus adspersus]